MLPAAATEDDHHPNQSAAPLLSNRFILAEAVSGGLSALLLEPQGVRLLPQRGGHKLYVLVEVATEFLGAADDVLPVDGGSEGALLHLFAHALGFHVLKALWAHEGNGDDKARELVDGVEGLGHGGVAGHVEVVGVALYGVEHIGRGDPLLPLSGTDPRGR